MSSTPEELWPRVEAALDRLYELEGEARARALSALKDDDPEIHAEVSAMLEAEENPPGALDAFLEAGASDFAAEFFTGEPPEMAGMETLAQGSRVGLYLIDEKIGVGGMSVVYRGHRDDGQFRQDVAIKVLRHPGRHPDLIRRFRMERQILGQLRYSNIARILDGGVSDGGWPYLVMEYIDGRPFHEFCRQPGRTLRENLALFNQVCAAVHHAHQHLVVHRDLKPSNILVTADGKAKLLDFGIAKLLDADPETFDHTVPFTETGMRLLTPDYAAPEQIRGEPITTATDIYALGILLYELLAGDRPYRLADKRASEIERIVGEVDPPPPSSIGNGDRSNTDLDLICLKALRKEPAHRYASAIDLAEDIERHLKGMPVLARPATATYRFGKFVRRNRWPVAATAGTLLFAIGFGIFAQMEAAKTEVARQQAESEARTAKATSEFLVELFRSTDPRYDRPDTLSVRGLLARGVQRADALKDQPEVHSSMLVAMGNAHHELGQFAVAKDLFERAREPYLDGRLQNLALESALLLDLARTLTQLEDHEGAITLGREALALALEEAESTPEDLRVGIALNELGMAHMIANQYDVADSLLARSLKILRRTDLGVDPRTLTDAEVNLASLHAYRGDFALALAVEESVLARRRVMHGPVHLNVAESLQNLAVYSRRLGDAPRAEMLYRESLKIKRALLPEAHESIALSLDNLAIALGVQRRFEESGEAFREALRIRQALWGEIHTQVASSYSNLGTLALRMGDKELSLSYSDSAISILRQVNPPNESRLALVLRNYSTSLFRLDRLAEARAFGDEGLEIYIRITGPRSTYVARSKGNLGAIALAQGNLAEAEALRREAIDIQTEAYGDTHPDLATDYLGLGEVLLRTERVDEARGVYQEALRIRTEIYGAEDPRTAACQEALDGLL